MKMQRLMIAAFAIVLFVVAVMLTPSTHVLAQQVGDQIILKMRFANQGVQGGGGGILQTGAVSNISTAVATATLTRVVVAPASNQTYVRGVIVEKSTGGTGSFTLQYGTGTNCGTGTTVLLGPVVNPPIQQYNLGLNIPAGQDLCVQTDASTTSVRVQSS